MITPNPSTDPNVHPLLKAADIQGRLDATKPVSHSLNPDTSLQRVCISDLVGLNNDLGLHLIKLPPGKSGCEMHHHYCDSEWYYILRGSGKLLLAPCEMESTGGASGMANVARKEGEEAKVEEHDVAPGDFAGFPGGPGGKGPTAVGPNGTPYAHTFVAGDDGLEYLCGGTRKAFDVCIYPLKQKTLLIDGGGARALTDFGVFKDHNTCKRHQPAESK